MQSCEFAFAALSLHVQAWLSRVASSLHPRLVSQRGWARGPSFSRPTYNIRDVLVSEINETSIRFCLPFLELVVR